MGAFKRRLGALGCAIRNRNRNRILPETEPKHAHTRPRTREGRRFRFRFGFGILSNACFRFRLRLWRGTVGRSPRGRHRARRAVAVRLARTCRQTIRTANPPEPVGRSERPEPVTVGAVSEPVTVAPSADRTRGGFQNLTETLRKAAHGNGTGRGGCFQTLKRRYFRGNSLQIKLAFTPVFIGVCAYSQKTL